MAGLKFDAMADIGNPQAYAIQPKQQSAPQQPQNKGNFLTSLIPSAGGIAGGLGGAAIGTAIAPGIGTILGGLLGGAIGGGGGKVAENAVEHQDNLGSGVAGEALINGILSAGPLRLLKLGGETVQGLRGGAGLADAIANAGTKAAGSSITKTIGNKLVDTSNDLAVKNFRLTPSQLSNFKNKFGEDASQVIKRYNLIGKDSGAIAQNAIQPLQSEFDTIASQIPSVSTNTVTDALKAKYGKLLNSAVEDNRAIGQQLKQQADTIAKKYGDTIPGDELSKLRQEFDSLSSYTDKAANPARYGVNKRAADAIRSVLQNTADNLGIKSSTGQSFKDVGMELNKLHQLTGNISRQEQLGRGSLPLGLTNLLGSGVGGGVGGIPGAIGGELAVNAINSATGRKLLATGAEKAGQALTDRAAKAAPYGVGQIAARVGGGNMALNAVNQGLSNSSASSMATPTTANPAINPANIPSSYTANAPGANPSDLTSALLAASGQQASPYSQANLMSDIQRDPKNADKYLGLFSGLQKATAAPSGSKLNATQLQQSNNAQSGLGALQTIQQELSKDPTVLLKANVPTNIAQNALGAGVFNTARKEASDVIARLRTGAAINDQEAKFYMNQLPQFGDNPDTINYKLNLLGTLFSRFASPQQPGAADASGSDLIQALLAAQGGQ